MSLSVLYLSILNLNNFRYNSVDVPAPNNFPPVFCLYLGCYSPHIQRGGLNYSVFIPGDIFQMPKLMLTYMLSEDGTSLIIKTYRMQSSIDLS